MEEPAERTLSARAVLPADTLARLRTIAEDTRTTWAEALIGCFAGFLHRLQGESDLVIAMPMMARSAAALRTPAMAVNVLPLRVQVHGGGHPPRAQPAGRRGDGGHAGPPALLR